MITQAQSIDTIIERQKLQEELRAIEVVKNNWIRTQVIENRRVDILAEQVFDLELQPFHVKMQWFTFQHDSTLQLAFRGSGKTTTVIAMRIVLDILLDPNVRILIVARTGDLAVAILNIVKQFIESDRFVKLFGDLKGDKWADSKITVKGRTKPNKEPTVSTVGTEGQLTGKHFDRIYADDLIDQNNARTAHMREQVHTFVYKTMMPTLEPDGQFHAVGTRYHPADIYGWWIEHEFAEAHQIIPALDDDNRSPWPQKYPPKFFLKQKERMGSVIFDTQYQCDTGKMRGGIFEYDWMQELSAIQVEEMFGNRGRVYIGTDVSVGEKEQSDFFALVAIRVVDRKILVERVLEKRLTFAKQLQTMAQWFDELDPVEMVVESNAYQAILAQYLKDQYPRIRIKRVITQKDKVTRAYKLASRFEALEVYFAPGLEKLISHLLLFPRGAHDDLFDALDLAVARAYKRKRRKRGRDSEVGLI